MDRRTIARAARVVLDGGIVAYPTDTVYGLGCDPRDAAAVDRLFIIKERERKPVSVLCSDRAKAAELVEFGTIAQRLASRYWPGALTIVLPLKADLPVKLHQNTGWLGVRVPDHRWCLSLIRRSGGFLTGTSANLSGAAPSRSAEDVVKQLGERVDLIIDGGKLSGTESTVVRVAAESVEVLRRGAISLESGVS
jgi:L-threonylcarbamoyladenylate synthase